MTGEGFMTERLVEVEFASLGGLRPDVGPQLSSDASRRMCAAQLFRRDCGQGD